MQNRKSADGLAWAVLADPPKAWQVETRQNDDAPAANATETGWDPTLEQSKKEIKLESVNRCSVRRGDTMLRCM